jgi:hypothetical protein
VAGWGDDAALEEVRRLVYEEGWRPISITIGQSGQPDTVVVVKDGEERTFTSDHLAFHRFAEGLPEDFPL